MLRIRTVPTVCSLILLAAATVAAQVPEHYYFRFNEVSGSTAADMAIPGHGVSTSNTVGWDFVNPRLGASCASGTAGNGNIRTNAPFSISGDWTVEFWIRHLPGPQPVSTVCGDMSSGFLITNWGNASVPGVTLEQLGGPFVQIQANIPAAALNGWIHFAFTYDSVSGVSEAFVNGSLVGTVNQLPGLSFSPTLPGELVIGGLLPQAFSLHGALDEFRFWGHVRTPAQIVANMSTELTPTPGSGQAPSTFQASLDLNNARSPLLNSVILGDPGPYSAVARSGGMLDFVFRGAPNQPFTLLFGTSNPVAATYPGIGQLDIGGPIDPLTGIPTGIQVLGDGISPRQLLDALFTMGSNGLTSLSIPLPSGFIPGPLGAFQTVNRIPGGSTLAISNSVALTIR